MSNTILSRRRFGLAAGAFAAAQVPAPGLSGVSAQDLVKRIQDVLGGEWPENSPDGFKAGDPQHPVRGIATTAMATMAVLRQSHKSGLNLIVTHEPTFFGREDGPSHSPVIAGRGPGPVSAEDPVYLAKKDFIEKNGMVVWRLRDHWKARKENDLTVGLGESLGWTRYRDSADEAVYAVPSATLEETVAMIRRKLNLRGGLRAVGDRKARVRRVFLQPGLMPLKTMLERFSEMDLIVAGEVREWECVHYAADMNAAGEKKSLITIGRVVSEDPGMRSCAHWLKTVVSGVPIQWITAGRSLLESGLMTAREVVELIHKNVGVPWNERSTRDRFKVGDPEIEVMGIATTMMTTFDMIRRAHQAGFNLIVTHEDTFWNDPDDTADLVNLPLYKKKLDYCTVNKIVVWRFHDHLHARKPDLTIAASLRSIGVEGGEDAVMRGGRVYTIPPTTLGEFASQIKKRTGARAMRCLGDPNAKISRILLGPGYAYPRMTADANVVIGGEAQETDGIFDNTEYVLDAAALGIPKGQIILGHAVSEEPGMEDCARWLETFITGVPIRFIPAGEPYWT